VTRILLVDDHAVVREGLKAMLARHGDLQVVAEADNGHDAIEAARQQRPDVAVIDLTMPSMNGLEAIRRVRALGEGTHVLVLSMHSGAEYVRLALRAGASGYLVKGPGVDLLVPAIRAVARGERFLDEEAARALSADESELDRPADDLELLTTREREVLQLVAEGQTNRQIAARLDVSPKTVDAHRTSLMRKLGLHTAQAVTRYALRRGLISH
jgi:two-component system, NarL family, response regulator NreC